MRFRIAPTDDPSILKFIADQMLVKGGRYEYSRIEEAEKSEVVQKLFHFPFVKKVYITANFIAIQRRETVAWTAVAERLRDRLEAFTQGLSVVVADDTENGKKRPIAVYAEMTPNPAVVKLISNTPLVKGVFEFTSVDRAKDSPLATELFAFPFVKEVFMTENYISITKHSWVEWRDIVLELREFATDYLRRGKTILQGVDSPGKQGAGQKPARRIALNQTEKRILEILDEQVKPAVVRDGGNIEFLQYDAAQKQVTVLLQGACNGCPSSIHTLKRGIEALLKQELPAYVESVEAHSG